MCTATWKRVLFCNRAGVPRLLHHSFLFMFIDFVYYIFLQKNNIFCLLRSDLFPMLVVDLFYVPFRAFLTGVFYACNTDTLFWVLGKIDSVWLSEIRVKFECDSLYCNDSTCILPDHMVQQKETWQSAPFLSVWRLTCEQCLLLTKCCEIFHYPWSAALCVWLTEMESTAHCGFKEYD